jgi:hypothetical protein
VSLFCCGPDKNAAFDYRLSKVVLRYIKIFAMRTDRHKNFGKCFEVDFLIRVFADNGIKPEGKLALPKIIGFDRFIGNPPGN